MSDSIRGSSVFQWVISHPTGSNTEELAFDHASGQLCVQKLTDEDPKDALTKLFYQCDLVHCINLSPAAVNALRERALNVIHSSEISTLTQLASNTLVKLTILDLLRPIIEAHPKLKEDPSSLEQLCLRASSAERLVLQLQIFNIVHKSKPKLLDLYKLQKVTENLSLEGNYELLEALENASIYLGEERISKIYKALRSFGALDQCIAVLDHIKRASVDTQDDLIEKLPRLLFLESMLDDNLEELLNLAPQMESTTLMHICEMLRHFPIEPPGHTFENLLRTHPEYFANCYERCQNPGFVSTIKHLPITANGKYYIAHAIFATTDVDITQTLENLHTISPLLENATIKGNALLNQLCSISKEELQEVLSVYPLLFTEDPSHADPRLTLLTYLEPQQVRFLKDHPSILATLGTITNRNEEKVALLVEMGKLPMHLWDAGLKRMKMIVDRKEFDVIQLCEHTRQVFSMEESTFNELLILASEIFVTEESCPMEFLDVLLELYPEEITSMHDFRFIEAIKKFPADARWRVIDAIKDTHKNNWVEILKSFQSIYQREGEEVINFRIEDFIQYLNVHKNIPPEKRSFVLGWSAGITEKFRISNQFIPVFIQNMDNCPESDHTVLFPKIQSHSQPLPQANKVLAFIPPRYLAQYIASLPNAPEVNFAAICYSLPEDAFNATEKNILQLFRNSSAYIQNTLFRSLYHELREIFGEESHLIEVMEQRLIDLEQGKKRSTKIYHMHQKEHTRDLAFTQSIKHVGDIDVEINYQNMQTKFVQAMQGSIKLGALKAWMSEEPIVTLAHITGQFEAIKARLHLLAKENARYSLHFVNLVVESAANYKKKAQRIFRYLHHDHQAQFAKLQDEELSEEDFNALVASIRVKLTHEKKRENKLKSILESDRPIAEKVQSILKRLPSSAREDFEARLSQKDLSLEELTAIVRDIIERPKSAASQLKDFYEFARKSKTFLEQHLSTEEEESTAAPSELIQMVTILKNLPPPSTEKESGPMMLTERERAFVNFAEATSVCTIGQLDNINLLFSEFIQKPGALTLTTELTSGRIQKMKNSVWQVYNSWVGEILSGESAFLKAVTDQDPINQESHQSTYVKNRLARILGYTSWLDIKYDPYTGVLSDYLVDLTTEELVETFDEMAPLSTLIDALKERIQYEFSQTESTYTTINEIVYKKKTEDLSASELALLWDTNDEEEEITLSTKGALYLLIATGILNEIPP